MVRPADPIGTNGVATGNDGGAARGVVDDRRRSGGDKPVVRFRRFELIPERRVLLCDGEPVELGGRAFDLLLVLLQARGEVVSKREIFERVWPSMTVDESNLRFQMACLRRVLGVDRDVIKTIQGRGYFLAAEGSDESLGAPKPDACDDAEGPASGSLQFSGSPERIRAEGALVSVIDDDANVREALDSLLRSAGLRVELFSSVQLFIDADALSRADCLILDVWMPGRSGLEFQAALEEAGVQIPIIFISGHADVPMSVRAMKAGAFEFLTKPVRHEELLSAIQSAIGQVAA